MNASHEYFEQLRTWFAQSVGRIYRTAWEVELPAGSSADWQVVCVHFGVTPLSETEREEVRAAQRPTRGAPVMEVAQTLRAVVRQARASLKRVDVSNAPPEISTLHDQLRQLFERTERDTVESYKRAVLPQRAGMFGNVLAHHAGQKQAVAGAYALLCKTCGAPRLKDADFICPFCNQHMASPEAP